MKFQVHSNDGLARRGTLTLAHGKVETPAFMPVGTYGAVKTMSPIELQEANTHIVLGNTFHLWLRPGLECNLCARWFAQVYGLGQADPN